MGFFQLFDIHAFGINLSFSNIKQGLELKQIHRKCKALFYKYKLLWHYNYILNWFVG